MINKNNWLIALLSVASLFIISCDKGDEPPLDTPTVDAGITFKFNHSVGPDQLEYNTIQYTNAFGNVYSVETLKYFISNINLHTAGGDHFKIDEEHYVDGTVSSTLTFNPSVVVPEGEYDSITFVFGLNEEKNVPGRYTNPPKSHMEWPAPLGGGYHYMKLEGKFNTSGNPGNYQGHTGPSMGDPYFIEVSLTAPQIISLLDGNKPVVTINMDINNWWTNPNDMDLNEVTGIMGNPGMQVKMQANGVDVFSILTVE